MSHQLSIYLALIFIFTVLMALLIYHYSLYISKIVSTECNKSQPLVFKISCMLAITLHYYSIGTQGSQHKKIDLNNRLYNAGLSDIVTAGEFILLKKTILVLSLIFMTCIGVFILADNEFIVSSLLLVIVVINWYPDLWLKARIKQHHEQFTQLFPFMLDLLVLSIRAGLTFTAAIDYAVKKLPAGPVKNEFSSVLFDIRTGLSRQQALRAMSNRLNILAVTNFVSIVNQIEEAGGELGTVLTVQAKQRRTERFLRAEKLANQAPVKMLAPLVGLLFPITIILILLPVYVKAKQSGAINMLF